MGRRRKYETAKAFETAVDAYFKSISRSVPMRIRTLVGYSNKGKPLYDVESFKQDNGKPRMTREYAEPPSVTGLCLHLGMSREALREYGEREELADAVATAKLRIEDYLGRELMTSERVEGVKFNLSHNFGWSEKQRIEAAVDTGSVTVVFEGAAEEWSE